MHVNDLSPTLEKFKGMWVALTETDTLISAHKRAKNAYQEAVKKGYKNPILFKVPQHDFPHVG
jgi:Family of unknown function (DUF5678)